MRSSAPPPSVSGAVRQLDLLAEALREPNLFGFLARCPDSRHYRRPPRGPGGSIPGAPAAEEVRQRLAAARLAERAERPQRIYFAHSMREYATARAGVALQEIARLWPGARVLDPEALSWSWLERALGGCEAVYRWAVEHTAWLVVLEHQGHVGRGVYTEVSLALEADKPVWALRRQHDRTWERCRVEGVELIDRRDWKVRYGRLVTESRGLGQAALSDSSTSAPKVPDA